MYSRIRKFASYFSQTAEPNQTITPSIPSEDENSTWVYVWNMTKNGPGHAALQIGGDKPKITEEQAGEYISIHPANIPAIGPTIVIPLPAEYASNLTQDMQIEYCSQNKEGINEFGGIPNQMLDSDSAKNTPPDRIYKIDGLDSAAMRTTIEAKKSGIKDGKLAYQLLPNAKLLSVLRDAPYFLNHDPIDVELHRRSLKKKYDDQIKVDNCTTFASDILSKGGMPIKKSTMPWGLTPNGLADQIEPTSLWHGSINSK